MGQIQAFLSYTRIDDDFFGGAITALRNQLQLAVQVVTGNREFHIFQDIEGIELGQRWQQRIEQALHGSRFLVPVLTPLFFSSDACRSELGQFITYERSAGRDDLILPIYFVTAPVLEEAEKLRTDGLAQDIRSRQFRDWRPHAEIPVSSTEFRQQIMTLARDIARASARLGQLSPVADTVRASADFERIRAESPERFETKPARAQARSETKRVLWVDDRPSNNAFERKAMEEYNIEFELAASTREALELLRRTKVDGIISDMGRPPDPRAGYTLLRAVRDLGMTIPFFIYAGSRAPEHAAEAAALGAQGTTNDTTELISMVVGTLLGKSPR